MFTLELHGEDVGILLRKLEKLPARWKEIVRQQFEQLAPTLIEFMRLELESTRTTGALEESISFDVQEQGNDLVMTVGPHASHAIFIRRGTVPHWAPIEPLKRWAAMKLGDEKAAYAVRWSIHEFGTSVESQRRHGTMENPYTLRTLDRSEGALQLFMQAVNNEMAEMRE